MRQAGWPIIQPARCEQNKKHLLSQMLFGTAEGIRTPDLLVRSQTLYPQLSYSRILKFLSVSLTA